MEEPEQEINLRNYLNVIMKRKRAILAIFFIAVIAAAVLSSLAPTTYRISMIIERGILDITDKGKTLYLSSAESVRAKIEEGIFSKNIAKALNLDPREKIFNFKVSQPVNLGLLKISIEQQDKYVSPGIEILNQLFAELHNFHEEKIVSEKSKIEKESAVLSDAVTAKDDEIKLCKELQKEKFKLAEKMEKQLNRTIELVQAHTEELLDKNTVLSKQRTAKDFPDIDIMRRNTDYVNQLQKQLAGLRSEKVSSANKIENIENTVENLKTKREKLNLKKDNIRNIKLIQNPQASLQPIRGPKRKLNIAIAGIVSLMFGVFLAFFQEFWETSK